jgi:hypothetical protein
LRKHANHANLKSIMAYFCSVFLGGLTAPMLGLIVLAQIAELNLPICFDMYFHPQMQYYYQSH